MGSVQRKKSPNVKIDGSKLIVEGQGILTKKISPPDKIPFKDKNTNSDLNQNQNNQ
jgi:hypothetical protein